MIYTAQLYAGDWYVLTTTGAPASECRAVDALPQSIFSDRADAEQAARFARDWSETTYATELTPEGEQTVIPGCERNAAPGARQLDLF